MESGTKYQKHFYVRIQGEMKKKSGGTERKRKNWSKMYPGFPLLPPPPPHLISEYTPENNDIMKIKIMFLLTIILNYSNNKDTEHEIF